MRIIHVLRKPLSEGTVASNVLKHGCGGLNIDASRVGSGLRIQAAAGGIGDGNIYGTADEYALGRGRDYRVGGRWPANVILQHLDGCRCEGTKRVKGSNPCTSGGGVAHKVYGVANKVYGPYGNKPVNDFTAPDGKETVANWTCEPGCPVARLDEQSGVSTSTGGTRRAGRFAGLYGAFSGENPGSSAGGLGDTGGASRFYKQVGGKSDG